MATTSRLVIERNVRVQMRDGVELATDVYRPHDAERHPVLLQRSPYDRRYVPIAGLDTIALGEAGYVVVSQDCRGRFASSGHFTPFADEANDGFDAIEWCATQPWSNGRVGMIGGSYVGATQWLPAGLGPPALKAIAPYVTASDYYEGWVYQGGAFQLGFSLRWSLESLGLPKLLSRSEAGESLDAEIAEARDAIEHIGALYRHRPLRGVDLLRRLAPWYDEWLAHPSRDAFWEAISPQERYATTKIPALNIAGWYDIFAEGTLRNFEGMRRGAATADGRAGELIVGPWSHSTDTGIFPERHFGSLASFDGQDPTGLHRRFFDRWLRDEGEAADGAAADGAATAGPDRPVAGPPVRIFVMGANRWHHETRWPPDDAEAHAWHLRGDAPANTARGAGRLSQEAATTEAPDAFLYDPRDPVPSIGGATLNQSGTPGWMAGPWDQRPLEARRDVLVYTSAPLEHPLEVIGPVEAVLFVSSSAPDTDFTAKLVDVAPSGRAEILADGIVRARYRTSLRSPEPLEPGRIYEIRINIGATANVFQPGHRVRLDVSSSNFPRFDANTNTGGIIADEGAEAAVPAINRVFHDANRPSRLLLSVVERH